MQKRSNHDTGCKARVALEALNVEPTVPELAAEYGVHPTMIHQWIEPLPAIGPRTKASGNAGRCGRYLKAGQQKIP